MRKRWACNVAMAIVGVSAKCYEDERKTGWAEGEVRA